MAEKSEETSKTEQKEEIQKLLDKSLDELAQNFSVSMMKYKTRESIVWISDATACAILIRMWSMNAWGIFSSWLNENKNKLYKKICVELKYCEKRKDSRWDDKVTLAAGLSDVVATLCVGFPPTLLSTILVKLGLDNICGCYGKYRCQGITKSGRPCSRLTSKKKGYCWQHKKKFSAN